jgi:hypothetical protein
MASTLKGKAAAAAKSLRSGANNRVANASKDIPMLGIAKNEDSKAVMECWFQVRTPYVYAKYFADHN